MKQHPRQPEIRSEIAIALAHLGWSIRQLADYSVLAGLPVGEHFLEDALSERWPAFRSKAEVRPVDNLYRVLGGLGVELRDDVFGIVPVPLFRLQVSEHSSQMLLTLALLDNFPDAQLRLVVQQPEPEEPFPAVALLINTGNSFILSDHPLLDGKALIGALYANCLSRLSVSPTQVSSIASLPVEKAIAQMQRFHYRPAGSVSRNRMLELLPP